MLSKNTERIHHTDKTSRSWDNVAEWYAGWSGPEGSRHHRLLAIPALMQLLGPMKGEHVLDIGCCAGALAPAILQAGAQCTGVDLSQKLIAFARRHHGSRARFIVGDATRLAHVPVLKHERFDAVTFLLSLQDINPLHDALASATAMLKSGGRLAILMTHPCFRIPRQSGWGWDEGRRLQFRRVDHYLTPLDVPMQEYEGGRAGATRSYHRPLQHYVEALERNGFAIMKLREIPFSAPDGAKAESRAERRAREQIPLFLGLKACRISPGP